MKQLRFVILALAAVVSLGATAQERVDTVIPKYLINGYFFREMPKLPDAVPSVTRLKDKEGNSVVAIGLNVDLPKSVIRQAIPRVHTGTDPFVLLHQGGGAFLCKIKCVIFGSIGNNVYLCRRKEYQYGRKRRDDSSRTSRSLAERGGEKEWYS